MERQKAIIILLVIVLAGTTVIAWWLWGRQEPLPDGLILTNGRIEGDHYTVAGKVSGRIVQLLAREGDSVKKGQILLTLDDVQIRARVDQARAAVNTVEAQVQAGRTELATLRKTVPLQIDNTRSGVIHAKAVMAAANVSKEQAARDAGRYRKLVKTHAVSRETSEHADLQLKVAREDFAMAQATLIQANKQLAEVELGWERI
ncbi:MAG TPA: secretion protein HlyD, partial [Nitrospiraceae bacterium]|nr:secretion protein HlyD [Nitrospiraceae bacterium]